MTRIFQLSLANRQYTHEIGWKKNYTDTCIYTFTVRHECKNRIHFRHTDFTKKDHFADEGEKNKRGSGTIVAQRESTMAKTASKRVLNTTEKSKRKILANFLAVLQHKRTKSKRSIMPTRSKKHSYISNACV